MRTCVVCQRESGLVCLDVSRYRGDNAFPGGPNAHLRGVPGRGVHRRQRLPVDQKIDQRGFACDKGWIRVAVRVRVNRLGFG